MDNSILTHLPAKEFFSLLLATLSFILQLYKERHGKKKSSYRNKALKQKKTRKAEM